MEESQAAAIARIREEAGGHEWRKTSLVGLSGGYDTTRCELCGATGKRYGVSWPPVPDKKKWKTCTAPKPEPETERTEPMSKKVELKLIRRDEEAQAAQMREKQNPQTIKDYAEAMENGDEFPEVILFFDGKDYWPGDGWKRIAAHEMAGVKGGIPASVRKGGLRQAILYAVGANHDNGERRSNADKRLAVSTLLKDGEWMGWSDGVIAKRAKVSQPFVSAMRREQEAWVPPEKKGEPGQPTQNVLSDRPTVRTGADGVKRSTANIGSGPRVTDRRRVNEAGESRSPAAAAPPEPATPPVAGILKGRALTISFTWIPGLDGKVNVSVNAGGAPQDARRELLDESLIPRFPNEIVEMIADRLKNTPAAKKKAGGK